jgi:hypothetical protein
MLPNPPGRPPIALNPCRFWPAPLTWAQAADGVTVENERYRAHISPWTGALDRVELKSGTSFITLLDDERFQVQTEGGVFHESHLGGVSCVIPDVLNSVGHRLYPSAHYLKVLTESPVNGTRLSVRRVYEFTQSEHIYVQFEIYANDDEELRSWFWWVHMPPGSTLIRSTLTRPISFMFPGYNLASRKSYGHPVNSIKTNYRGYEVQFTDRPTTANGTWARWSTQVVELRKHQRVVGGVALSVVPAGAAHHPAFTAHPLPVYPMYPEYGLLDFELRDEQVTDSSCRFEFDLTPGRPSGVGERFFHFADLNVYQNLDGYAPVQHFPSLDGTSPVRARGALDQLIRANMHLLERMAHDGGWPIFAGWSRYVCGCRYTASARGFSSAVYLWAYLTLGWDGQRWVKCTNTTDPIWEQLQGTDRFFEPGTDSFSDRLSPPLPEEDYIAYVNRYRENNPNVPYEERVRGVINAHGHALHFVAMMRDAARLKGDAAAAVGWQSRLARFHRGSKALFAALHPATDAERGTSYPGVLNYSLGQEKLGDANVYAPIAFRGITPGYLDAGEYELGLIEAVERLRHDWSGDWRNETAGVQGLPNDSTMWSLTRANPLSLSFLREPTTAPPDLAMWRQRGHALRADYLESAVKLDDVLQIGRQPLGAIHNRALYIRDGLGRYVLTNTQVLSDWIPGSWEEVAYAAVPADRRFAVEVPEIPFDGSLGFWTAVQKDQRIELMTSAATPCRPRIGVDALYGSARVVVRRHRPMSSAYPHHGTWGEELQQVAARLVGERTGDRCRFQMPAGFTLGRKDLLIVELERRPSIPANVRTSGPPFSDAFSVQWDAVAAPAGTGALRYELQTSRNRDFAPATTIDVGAATGRSLPGQADGRHYVRVRACTAVCGDYSAAVERVVQIVPTAPTALRVGTVAGSSYALTWEGATGYITRYEIQEARTAGFTSPTLITVLGLLTSRLFTNQARGTYYYRIRAVNDRGRASGYTTLVGANGAPLPVVVP